MVVQSIPCKDEAGRPIYRVNIAHITQYKLVHHQNVVKYLKGKDVRRELRIIIAHTTISI
jgi:hypothetical protein